MATLGNAVSAAVNDLTASKKSILECLSTEMRAALESKFMTLPIEVRSTIASTYPTLGTAEQYIVRQMRREANAKLASNQRPIWFNKLVLNAASLQSGDKVVREYAEKELRQLAEELDAKESATLVKKYKVSKDMTSENSHIKQLCGIFGIEPATIK